MRDSAHKKGFRALDLLMSFRLRVVEFRYVGASRFESSIVFRVGVGVREASGFGVHG